MKLEIEAKISKAKIANKQIQQSFAMENFTAEFFSEITALVVDDVHLNEAEIYRRNWVAIYSDNNDGYLDTEREVLIEWWAQQGIDYIYSTSRKHLIESTNDQVLVMKLANLTSLILCQIESGMWMFGEIPELAQARIADWHADIWFSRPLRFIILFEHGGYGTTTVAGPPELIEIIKTSTTHGLYEWKDGVVPD
jgi:hypothetical protein